jgi:hypothetical protein
MTWLRCGNTGIGYPRVLAHRLRQHPGRNVSNRKHPLTANGSPSFRLRRAIGARCHYRAENLDQEKHKTPFRPQIDQSRPNSSGNQIPPEMKAGFHGNNILTISGLPAHRFLAILAGLSLRFDGLPPSPPEHQVQDRYFYPMNRMTKSRPRNFCRRNYVFNA